MAAECVQSVDSVADSAVQKARIRDTKGQTVMAVKTDTEVIIGGRVLTLSGYESEEYLQKVASYINNKLAEYPEHFSGIEHCGRLF